MSPRPKKLFGAVALLLGVVLYALVVIAVAQAKLATVGPLIQLGFFAFFGLLWIVPAGLLIRWMERSDRTP